MTTLNTDQPAGFHETKGKSKHITTACTACRKRKIKCDGKAPTCSNCQLYNETCVYRHGVDGRKVRSKHKLQSQRSYIQRLESMLKAHEISLPPNADTSLLGTHEQEEREEHVRPSLGVGEMQPLSNAEVELELHPLDSGDPGLNVAAYDIYLDTFHRGPTTDPNATTYNPNQNMLDLDGSTEETQASSPLMDQLSGRMGALRIAGDGQLRFFGATSNLHILLTGTRQSPGSFHTSMQEVQTTLNSAGLGNAVDLEFEDHLLRLYFAWEDPSIHVVNERYFYRERTRFRDNNESRGAYSETLTNAMCAVGAALTPRHWTELPERLVDFFVARAKELLEVEMDCPKLSTVSSLVILSGVEALLSRDSRGWIYSGMAMRIATDLGLHLDVRAYIDAGILTQEEAMLRSTVFWGTFIHERMWSLYLGRPESLDENRITIPRPSYLTSESTNQLYWTPYIDECERSTFPALPSQVDEVHGYNISLCTKMTRIRDAIYSDNTTLTQGSAQLFTNVNALYLELLHWYAELPQSLCVDEDSLTAFYLPHVLQLHMQYHCLVILANRPFFSRNTPSFGDVSSLGRTPCTHAATSLTRLLKLYRRLFTFRRINIQAVHLIFTASLIHVYNSCRSSNRQVQNAAWRDLEICCQALSEIGQGYSNAIRAHEVVMNIKTELLQWNRAHVKRDEATASNLLETQKPFKKWRLRADNDGERMNNPEPRHWPSFRTHIVSSQDQLFWSEVNNPDLQRFKT